MKKNQCPEILGKSKKSNLYCNSISSQRARILKHFKECSPRLSTIQARTVYGILHPAGRIMELKKSGYKIVTHMIKEKDNNGVNHRIGLYVYYGKGDSTCEK